MAILFTYLAFFLAFFVNSWAALTPLKVGFYYKTCPQAETIVKNTVNKAYSQDPGIAAALLRLHFHDCFVRGCDASILIDSTPKNQAEKDSTSNYGVQGFDIIDEAKKTIEAQCPNTVSCADIVAFAARDGVFKAGGVYYAVPGGRRDGRVSLKDEVTKNLPGPFFDATQLEENFAKKGLPLEDMVTLSGAHSIGDSHCSSFSRRLYATKDTQFPSMNLGYANYLRTKCPRPSNNKTAPDPIVPFDPTTPTKLDNNYYKNLKSDKGLLVSDQTLWDSKLTRKMVRSNANHAATWAANFAKAMVHMGSIEVLTGMEGEIRKNCRIVN